MVQEEVPKEQEALGKYLPPPIDDKEGIASRGQDILGKSCPLLRDREKNALKKQEALGRNCPHQD